MFHHPKKLRTDMKNLYFHIIAFLTAVLLVTSCSKGDDGDAESKKSDADGGNSTVFLQEVKYSLTVKCGGSVSKAAYAVDDESGVVTPIFTEEDVAKSLVMNVSGKDVTGSLTLKSTDGTFVGTLTVPADIADTLVLTGSIEIPAADGADNDRSNVSLDDLIQKCGHRYTVSFKYKNAEPLALTDNKAYFHFIMSPLQHWLLVNSNKYTMSNDGEVWIAIDENTSLVTSFYKVANGRAAVGKVCTIDHSGLVDLCIPGVLWADKNVGAESYEDAGSYFEWIAVQSCVSAPMEATSHGESDFQTLCSITEHKWGEYKGVPGLFFCVKGFSDHEKNPFIFLPAGGIVQHDKLFQQNEIGSYWNGDSFDSQDGYRFYFNQRHVSIDNHISKDIGSMMVRPVCRIDAKDVNAGSDEKDQPKEVQPFFPVIYSWDDVAAWYTYKRDEARDEWALYLFKNNTYVVTQYKADTDARVIQNVGDFTINGAADAEYNNFDITATVWRQKKNYEFIDGACKFLNRTFRRELEQKPLMATHTKDNTGTSILYFPWIAKWNEYQVVAWYKQIDPADEDEDFMALYIYSDNSFNFVKCWIKDGEQVGANILGGFFEKDGIVSVADFNNASFDFHFGDYITRKGTLDIKDGVCTVSGYKDIKMQRKDLNLFMELAGLK